MEIQFKGEKITNLEKWKDAFFSGKKEKHWKEDRSAYSLADFILNKKGINMIKEIVSSIVKEEVNISFIQPEFESRFDKYGHGREHDLAILGSTFAGKKVFIGVESKVDEKFGDTIGKAYLRAKAKELNGEKTNAPKRIERLLETSFDTIKESDFNLRYQLLFSTAGTLCEEADIHIFLILVFKTDLYNPEIGNKNHKDLIAFLRRINAKEKNKGYYTASINNKELHIIYKEIDCQAQR